MRTDELVERIKRKGYWRVVIRPTTFDKHLIPRLSEAKKLVQSSKVSWRGWDYPHFDESASSNMADWVECWSDCDRALEYWRFYKSGQFIHLFAAHEDLIDDIESALPTRYPPRPRREGYLGFVGATFTVTEIFEFAARLANKDVLRPSAFVSVGLHNMEDHQLASFGGRRFLPDGYVYETNEPIVVEREIPQAELIAKPDDFALDSVIQIFERFGWDDPPRQILGEDQKRLRERRL
jgi:hypothetical protein